MRETNDDARTTGGSEGIISTRGYGSDTCVVTLVTSISAIVCGRAVLGTSVIAAPPPTDIDYFSCGSLFCWECLWGAAAVTTVDNDCYSTRLSPFSQYLVAVYLRPAAVPE